MAEPYQPPRSWTRKFCNALRGIALGARTDGSIVVQFLAAITVAAAAAAFRVTPLDWCLLVLCIAIVITAEFLNSALESLARAVTSQYDPHIHAALDLASGGVLVLSLGAAVVGGLVFWPYVSQLATGG